MHQAEGRKYSPDEVSPPGETLVDILNSKGMSQADLAERTGRPKKTINEIIKNRAMITSETAVQFERVLGVSASFWAKREAQYRAHLAKAEEAKQLKKHIDWPQCFPLTDLRKREWISKKASGVELVRELLDFLGIASPDNFNPVYALTENHFRKSEKYEVDAYALAAWLRRGETEAAAMDCAPFDRQRFVSALGTARSLTLQEPPAFASALADLCRAAGVAVVFVEELPKIRTNGATRWLSPDKALIQLCLRHKRADILWFTFFHEAGHILLHGKKDVFVELDKLEKSEKEREADQFAGDILIPPKKLRAFLDSRVFSAKAITEFARDLGIHTGIVLGRLQYEKVLEHRAYPNLLMRVDWE
jgi:HTH-type transcriptional regulator / antitoxin HigA